MCLSIKIYTHIYKNVFLDVNYLLMEKEQVNKNPGSACNSLFFLKKEEMVHEVANGLKMKFSANLNMFFQQV